MINIRPGGKMQPTVKHKLDDIDIQILQELQLKVQM